MLQTRIPKAHVKTQPNPRQLSALPFDSFFLVNTAVHAGRCGSVVFGLLVMMGFERLARVDLSQGTSRRAAVYLLHAPLAFVLFAPYTEALFLLSSVIVFLMARRRAWWMAGMAAGLAALTRQQGI